MKQILSKQIDQIHWWRHRGCAKYKPCPFEFGLRKFALDPIVVIFFKKCQKNYKCWIKCISKNLQRLDQPTLVIFFENEKILISKKNTTMGFKWCFDPIVVIFFEIKIFSFPKKLQVLADPVVVNFFEMHLIQHL